MQGWILEKIQYPTGGHTAFEYEPHHDGVQQIGGLRVKRMVFRATEGQDAQSKTYTYSNGK
jgi:hypothetical protein